MAVEILSQELPEFFRNGRSAIVHSVIDPDVTRLRELPQLRNRESPEHYLDWEEVGNIDFPATRYDFVERIQELGRKPTSTGFLPYAIAETFQELTLAFAEHRRWPDNPHIQSKILIIAGHLAHYAGDLCQPLHTTIHYNGRTTVDAESPSTGIHFAVDGIFESTGLEVSGLELKPAALASENLLGLVQQQFEESFALVDLVYELESELRAVHEGASPSARLIAFAKDRQRTTVLFISGLFQSAWVESESLELPPWLRREDS